MSLDPITLAAILAMASLPDFDPNRYGQASTDARFNRNTQGTYELGSLFTEGKIIEAVAKLRELVAQARREDPKATVEIHYGRYLFSFADELRQMIQPRKGNLADSLLKSKGSWEEKTDQMFLSVGDITRAIRG